MTALRDKVIGAIIGGIVTSVGWLAGIQFGFISGLRTHEYESRKSIISTMTPNADWYLIDKGPYFFHLRGVDRNRPISCDSESSFSCVVSKFRASADVWSKCQSTNADSTPAPLEDYMQKNLDELAREFGDKKKTCGALTSYMDSLLKKADKHMRDVLGTGPRELIVCTVHRAREDCGGTEMAPSGS